MRARIDAIRKRRSAKVTETEDAGPVLRYAGSVAATYRQIYPKYLASPHLDPVRELFERAKRERVYACVSLPPRAGKTETLIAGVVDRLMEAPGTRVGWANYAQRLSDKKSNRIRSIARDHGVPIDPESRAKKDWRTGVGEGGLWATSVGGSIVGEGFDLLVLDDLLSGRNDAESAAIRDKTFDWIVADGLSRMEPEGSVILCGTRYHSDDHIGRMVKTGEWEEYVIPAILHEDTPTEASYWPERWTLERMRELRTERGGITGYEWCSTYQGNPRAPGERIFGDAIWAADLPHLVRIGIGVDFAYTVGKSSDYSAAVVLGECGGQYIVLDVLRVKVPEAEFRARVKALCEHWGAQFVTGYIAATEQPNIDLLQMGDVPAFGRRAVADKKVRALPTAAGWNTGRIRVRNGQAWTKDFIAEVQGFTGSDRHDDQVDALAAVYDAMFVGGAVDWDLIDALASRAPKPHADWIGPHAGLN